jgi:hypothetical protein
MRVTGHSFVRFAYFYPGPLASVLGPPDTEPDVDLATHWVFDAPLPGMWIVHRAIVAVLLAERGTGPTHRLAEAALGLLRQARPDPDVQWWIKQRAQALLP